MLGRVINLDGIPSIIIGVIPAGFRYPANNVRSELFSAIERTGNMLDQRGGWRQDGFWARKRAGCRL